MFGFQPPCVRGKVISETVPGLTPISTPVCTGKRLSHFYSRLNQYFNPRVYGEKLYVVFVKVFVIFQPPCIRGKEYTLMRKVYMFSNSLFLTLSFSAAIREKIATPNECSIRSCLFLELAYIQHHLNERIMS